MATKLIKDILISSKVLPVEDIERADVHALKNNKPLLQALVDLKLMDKMHALSVVAKEWKTRPISLEGIAVDPGVVKLVSDAVARKTQIIPFMKEDQTLLVAVADPAKAGPVIENLRANTGCQIQTYLAMASDIDRELDKIYSTGSHHDAKSLDEQIDDMAAKTKEIMESLREAEDLAQVPQLVDVVNIDASSPDVEKIVNAIILTAIQQKASDIHIEPFEDPAGKKSRLVVRYRVDGFLKESAFRIPWGYRQAILAKLKIMTQSMNLTERRIPQSGRIQVMAKGRPIEFRVETIPTVYGESASLRILDRKNVQVDLNKMGFLPDMLERLLDQLKGVGGKKNYGMILVTGPTGSGKTTTLYGCLNYINRPDIRIITAENPVEYNIDGIVQVQVNPDVSLGHNKVFNFAMALRSFLRLDPDVVMVGEIRDRETAQIAMEAAMTGHLVLSTLHTNDAPSTVSRLAEMGIPSFLVANTIKCVIAQRLCRGICPQCKTSHPPTADEIEIFRLYGFSLPEGTTFASGKGCKNCAGTGFKGRIGMHEILLMDEAVRRVALTDLSADSIRTAAIVHSPQRMRTIVQDGLIKVSQGLTTVSEVLGVMATEKSAS